MMNRRHARETGGRPCAVVNGVLLILCLTVLSAPGASFDAGSGQDLGRWLREADRLTGQWGGVRPRMEDHGFRVSLYWNQFWAYADRGRYSGSIDLFGEVDFGKLGWVPGGEALVQVKNNHGMSINQDMAAWGQPIDDADGDHPLYIANLYYQQSSPHKTFQLRLGYLDLQSALDRNVYANSEDKQFMNTYLDNNNATIPLKVGPSISLFCNPTDWLSLVLAVSEGDSQLYRSNLGTTFDGDWDYIGFYETGFRLNLPTPRGKLPGHYRFGLLYDSRPATDDEGFYLSLDQQIYAENGSRQGLGLFCRYGWRPARLGLVKHFWSAGAQYQGLLPGRDDDTLGFGAYSAIATGQGFHRETGYEIYYKAQLTPAVALTPGLQYIHQPGANAANRDELLFAFRTRVAF